MTEVVTPLKTRWGYAGYLAQAIRGRKKRSLPLRLTPVEGTASKYKVYASCKALLGETVVRSKRARRRLSNGERPKLTIGWNENRNETLQVHIPA